MSNAFGKVGLSGDLTSKVIRAPQPHRIKTLARTPFGRLMWSRDKGDATITGREQFISNLTAHIFQKGRLADIVDLGSGLVTNTGVNMMANEPTWVAASTPFATLSSMLYVSTGTGGTAAAASDVWLQTVGTHFSGGTNNYFTGVLSVTTPNVWKNVATVNYSGTETVSEWVICMNNAATVARTSAGAAPTQTTFTDTGATFTTAGNGLKGFTVQATLGGTILNTSTLAQAQILSNTATVLTVTPGPDGTHWYSGANLSVATPAATIQYTVFPTAFDHKQFTGIGVNNGDSIQFTYSLTIQSGG